MTKPIRSLTPARDSQRPTVPVPHSETADAVLLRDYRATRRRTNELEEELRQLGISTE